MGTVSATVSGMKCQSWSSNTPHVPAKDASVDANYPDGSRKAAKNYCRNPYSSWTEGVWCYTTNPNRRWEPCDVPLCNGTCTSIFNGVTRVGVTGRGATDGCHPIFFFKKLTNFLVIAVCRLLIKIFHVRLSSVRSKFGCKNKFESDVTPPEGVTRGGPPHL